MTLTTSAGAAVDDNAVSQTAGRAGPVLLQDFHLLDKLAHFDRERIPERVVHAKGAGAHGFFECTSERAREWTAATPFEAAGKRTPVFVRFSTVGGERGSADTARDPRGFAVKFYTDAGNWDLVANNTPVFFVRDPLKFPDFIHTQKRHPVTNLKDADMFWDFLSLVPESLHQVTVLFSERGTPDGFRHMDGFGSHTFVLVDGKGKARMAKFHLKTDQKIKNLTAARAEALAATDPDYATRDLYDAIARGDFPSWTMHLQVMEVPAAMAYRFSSLDVTKVWLHADAPMVPVGRLVLNRNPANYFAEVEQAAFSPSHVVPGVLPSADRMLQGRLFSYPDTHRHRLGGPNYTALPINRPLAPVKTHHRDGPHVHTDNGGGDPNYEPNSIKTDDRATGKSTSYVPDEKLAGTTGRHSIAPKDAADDFVQPGMLFRLQPPDEQAALVSNMAGSLAGAKPHIRRRQIGHLRRADPAWATRVEKDILSRVGSKL